MAAAVALGIWIPGSARASPRCCRRPCDVIAQHDGLLTDQCGQIEKLLNVSHPFCGVDPDRTPDASDADADDGEEDLSLDSEPEFDDQVPSSMQCAVSLSLTCAPRLDQQIAKWSSSPCCKCKPTKVMRDNCMKSNDNSEESC